MNGITHLNLYPALNMVAVKGAVSVFNSAVASNAFAELPGLQERVMRAQLLINSHSRSLVDQAIALEASLSNAGISDIAKQYKGIAEASSLDPKLKAKGLEDLNAFCQERLRHVVQKVEAAQGLIEANRAEIGALTLDHFAGDLIDYDEARLTALVTREAALKENRNYFSYQFLSAIFGGFLLFYLMLSIIIAGFMKNKKRYEE